MVEIGIGQDQAIWAKIQGAKGTPEWPSATDAVRVTGDGKFSQDRSLYDSKEKVLSLDPLERVPGLYKAGEFSFPCYIRAAGALGVVPVPAAILKSWWGKETIVTSTSVAYDLYTMDDAPVYLTVLVKNNFVTMLVYDLVVRKGTLPIIAADSPDAIVEGSFSGEFLKSLIAGTDATSQLEALNATAIHVVDARKYEIGQKIIVGTSGVTAGHLITDVVVSTNIVTIAATGLDSEQASGAVVKGWTPVITTSGYLMHGRYGKYQEKIGAGAYTDVLITEGVFELDNGWEASNDEKDDTDYGSSFSFSKRDIACKISRYVRSDGAVYRHEANNMTQKLIKLQAASGPYSLASGKRFEIAMPNAQIDPPSESGDTKRKYEIALHAFATAALNDAAKLTFD